jgi:hypothetical protein
MFDRIKTALALVMPAILVVLCAGTDALADNAVWRVSKSTGEVWVTTSGAQQVSLKSDAMLQPGDSISTGRNGRVLLVRGNEKILISPNSVIGVPAKSEGSLTTITQQAGTILFSVEKQDRKHFEVETPFLAAVVRGTQFRVAVNGNGAQVDVAQGQVEVSDFRSGQYALVHPGQTAKTWAQGLPGLSLTGSGSFSRIQYGVPRASTLAPMPMPDEGRAAPNGTLRSAAWNKAEQGFAAFEGNDGHDGLWDSVVDFVRRSVGLGDRAQGRNANEPYIIAIPLLFGGAIAVAVAVRRKRQRQK